MLMNLQPSSKEKWEIRSWAEGSGTAHGYLNNVIFPSGTGGDGYIQMTWTPND